MQKNKSSSQNASSENYSWATLINPSSKDGGSCELMLQIVATPGDRSVYQNAVRPIKSPMMKSTHIKSHLMHEITKFSNSKYTVHVQASYRVVRVVVGMVSVQRLFQLPYLRQNVSPKVRCWETMAQNPTFDFANAKTCVVVSCRTNKSDCRSTRCQQGPGFKI